MSDIELTNSTSSELTGFSTPPSSSLDTCDSGFNDLYSNSFTLISSASSGSCSSSNSKCSRTTPAQIDQSDSSPESEQLFDDNSMIASESQSAVAVHNIRGADEQTGASVDRPPPPPPPPVYDGGAVMNVTASHNPMNAAQLDLTSLDYEQQDNDTTTNKIKYDSSSSCSSSGGTHTGGGSSITSSSGQAIGGENDADDYNDDSNMSDISDLSDVFKLNSDFMPEMQRSIDWVSVNTFLHCFLLLLSYSAILMQHFPLC